MFIRNSNSDLSLEEQKLKLFCIITECEIRVARLNGEINKKEKRERNHSC